MNAFLPPQVDKHKYQSRCQHRGKGCYQHRGGLKVGEDKIAGESGKTGRQVNLGPRLAGVGEDIIDSTAPNQIYDNQKNRQYTHSR